MELHEKRCFRNPDRYCDYCHNDGTVIEDDGGSYGYRVPCPYCAKFDETIKTQKEWEKDNLL